MLSKLRSWYGDWEKVQLDVLERPELAWRMAPGWRRCCAIKLARLSLIERRQLHAFSLKYRGRRLTAAIAIWLLAFSAIGLVFHLLHPAKAGVHVPIIVANALGVAMVCVSVSALFGYRQMVDKGFRKAARIFLLSMGGALLGVATVAMMQGKPLIEAFQTAARDGLLVGLAATVLLALPIGIIGVLRNRQYVVLTAQLQHEAERARLAKEVSEARLAMLRAQIEPHFLFNTLGAVQQLAEQGAPRAAELTANLIAFLRASLAEMRTEHVSLQAEFALVESYLQVMKARLGERLRFSLALPDALAQMIVPSMILLTLVENAIKHGIEPSLRGGEVAVTARQDGGVLSLQVQDSGVGLGAKPGHGLGMDNVRTRLQLAYGSDAALRLSERADGGVIAAVSIPLQQSARKG